MSCTARRALTIVLTTLAALLLWAGTGAVVELRLDDGTEVGAVAVVVVSLLAGLAAWGTLAVLGRITARPRRIWFPLTITVLVLSLLGPLGAATVGAGLALAGLHLLVGVALIVGLPEPARVDAPVSARG